MKAAIIKFDNLQKDIFMYCCENHHVNIDLLMKVVKESNYIIHREDFDLYEFLPNVANSEVGEAIRVLLPS